MGSEGRALQDQVNGFAGRVEVIEGPKWNAAAGRMMLRHGSSASSFLRAAGHGQRGGAPASDIAAAFDTVAASSTTGSFVGFRWIRREGW